MSKIDLAEGAEPATPSTGRVVVYVDSADKHVKAKDDAGVVRDLAEALGVIATTKGDILVHNGTGLVRLPVGADYQLLRAEAATGEGVAWANVVRGLQFAAFNAEVDNGNSGAALNVDWTAGNFQRVTLTDACTFTFTDPVGVSRVHLKLVQDATGSRVVTWPPGVRWPGGASPVLSTAANAIDIVTLVYDGTEYFAVAGLNFL